MISLPTLLPWVQISLSVILTTMILFQSAGEGGLGGVFGGGDGGTFHTKRGFERVLFISTIVVAILFGLSAFVALVI